MTEKLSKCISLTKALVIKQQEQHALLAKIVLHLLHKEEGPFTVDAWERRKSEVLYQAGLGPKPVRGSWM